MAQITEFLFKFLFMNGRHLTRTAMRTFHEVIRRYIHYRSKIAFEINRSTCMVGPYRNMFEVTNARQLHEFFGCDHQSYNNNHNYNNSDHQEYNPSQSNPTEDKKEDVHHNLRILKYMYDISPPIREPKISQEKMQKFAQQKRIDANIKEILRSQETLAKLIDQLIVDLTKSNSMIIPDSNSMSNTNCEVKKLSQLQNKLEICSEILKQSESKIEKKPIITSDNDKLDYVKNRDQCYTVSLKSEKFPEYCEEILVRGQKEVRDEDKRIGNLKNELSVISKMSEAQILKIHEEIWIKIEVNKYLKRLLDNDKTLKTKYDFDENQVAWIPLKLMNKSLKPSSTKNKMIDFKNDKTILSDSLKTKVIKKVFKPFANLKKTNKQTSFEEVASVEKHVFKPNVVKKKVLTKLFENEKLTNPIVKKTFKPNKNNIEKSTVLNKSDFIGELKKKNIVMNKYQTEILEKTKSKNKKITSSLKASINLSPTKKVSQNTISNIEEISLNGRKAKKIVTMKKSKKNFEPIVQLIDNDVNIERIESGFNTIRLYQKSFDVIDKELKKKSRENINYLDDILNVDENIIGNVSGRKIEDFKINESYQRDAAVKKDEIITITRDEFDKLEKHLAQMKKSNEKEPLPKTELKDNNRLQTALKKELTLRENEEKMIEINQKAFKKSEDSLKYLLKNEKKYLEEKENFIGGIKAKSANDICAEKIGKIVASTEQTYFWNELSYKTNFGKSVTFVGNYEESPNFQKNFAEKNVEVKKCKGDGKSDEKITNEFEIELNSTEREIDVNTIKVINAALGSEEKIENLANIRVDEDLNIKSEIVNNSLLLESEDESSKILKSFENLDLIETMEKINEIIKSTKYVYFDNDLSEYPQKLVENEGINLDNGIKIESIVQNQQIITKPLADFRQSSTQIGSSTRNSSPDQCSNRILGKKIEKSNSSSILSDKKKLSTEASCSDQILAMQKSATFIKMPILSHLKNEKLKENVKDLLKSDNNEKIFKRKSLIEIKPRTTRTAIKRIQAISKPVIGNNFRPKKSTKKSLMNLNFNNGSVDDQKITKNRFCETKIVHWKKDDDVERIKEIFSGDL